MKTMTFVAVLILAGTGMANAQEAQPAGPATEKQAVTSQAVCPITGGQVNTNLCPGASSKEDKPSCKGCPRAAKKDPAKCGARQVTDGVKLDNPPVAAPAKQPAAAGAEAAPVSDGAQPAKKAGGCGACCP